MATNNQFFEAAHSSGFFL